jgi:hypothetical protein
MIGKAIKSIKNALSPQNITVNMDGGVGGSWKVECSIDDTPVDCQDLQENYDEGEAFKQDAVNYYTGIPAPAYLPDDEWFGPAPIRSEKQLDYMAVEREWKIEEEKKRKERGIAESSDIHQKMYEIATAAAQSTLDRDPIGGSENFHQGPGGTTSGNGFGRFQ